MTPQPLTTYFAPVFCWLRCVAMVTVSPRVQSLRTSHGGPRGQACHLLPRHGEDRIRHQRGEYDDNIAPMALETAGGDEAVLKARDRSLPQSRSPDVWQVRAVFEARLSALERTWRKDASKSGGALAAESKVKDLEFEVGQLKRQVAEQGETIRWATLDSPCMVLVIVRDWGLGEGGMIRGLTVNSFSLVLLIGAHRPVPAKTNDF